MFFLNPSYLWALIGLTIPIAIHLWSKKEGKTIKIGTVQFLNKADTKQSSSIQLNEFWLLLLRLLLIFILVLIMSNLQIRKKIDNAAITYIVESSLLQNKKFKSILDTISRDIPIKLLQQGFPEIDIDANPQLEARIPNYWQLAKEMKSIPSDSIIVFTNTYQSGFKGMRPEINKSIEWIPIATNQTSKRLLKVNQLDEQLELLLMKASDQHISFDKELLQSNNTKIKWNTLRDSIFYLDNWIAIHNKKTIKILLFYDDDLFAESNYFEAGFEVVCKYLNYKIDLVKTNQTKQIGEKEFDIVVWFSKKPVLKTNGKVVLFKSNQFANQLIEKNSIQGVYHLTELLNIENIEKDHLPEQLIQLLDLNPTIKNKINKYDRRVMDKKSMIPSDSKNKLVRSSHQNLDMTKWLWALFVLLLISERIVSYHKQQ